MDFSSKAIVTLLSGTLLIALALSPQAAQAHAPATGNLSNSVSSSSPEPSSDPAPDKSATACVTHTTQARYIMGYDHLVHINNDCEKSVECKVSTDVNPDPQSVTLDPKTKKTVVTFKGSPARVFRATVDCRIIG